MTDFFPQRLGLHLDVALPVLELHAEKVSSDGLVLADGAEFSDTDRACADRGGGQCATATASDYLFLWEKNQGYFEFERINFFPFVKTSPTDESEEPLLLRCLA
jgi:hypothetical protein